MKDFSHGRPPFAVGALRQRLLQRVGELPPGLRLRIGRHSGHVGGEITPHILEIGEELRASAEDRVVADVARINRRKHLRPHCSVEALIGLDLVWLEAYDLAKALYIGSLRQESSLAKLVRWETKMQQCFPASW